MILRAVFGMEKGPRLDDLRETLTGVLALGESPLSLLPAVQLASSAGGRRCGSSAAYAPARAS